MKGEGRPASRVKYEPALDGLRGLSALLVLFFHAAVPGFSNGRDGIVIFFVLSGYLITSLLLAEAASGPIDLRAFWLRRLGRLVPALSFVVAATVSVFAIAHEPLPLIEPVLAITYTMNIAALLGHPFTPLFHTWTLALEMQFYILWPFAVTALARSRRPVAMLVFAWGVLTLATVAVYPFGDRWLYYLPTSGISFLLIGSIMAFMPPLSQKCGIAGAVLVFLALFADLEAIRLPALAAGSAALIGSLRTPSPISRLLGTRSLVGLGVVSYGLYLWQYPILSLLGDHFPWFLRLSIAGGLSTALAVLSYHSVEHWGRAIVATYLLAQPVEAHDRAIDKTA